MERPNILNQKEKIKNDYFGCSTPKCGVRGLCHLCIHKKPLIDLFAYIEHLENELKIKGAF